MLDFSDRMRTGISILTSAADEHTSGIYKYFLSFYFKLTIKESDKERLNDIKSAFVSGIFEVFIINLSLRLKRLH